MWNVAFSLEETLKSRGGCAELRNRGLMQAVVLEKRLRLVALLRRTDEVFQEILLSGKLPNGTRKFPEAL